MRDSQLFKHTELLLRILPIVNQENVFALKGGTANNFFVRELLGLSVDIDFVYFPVNKRLESFEMKR